MRFLTGRMNRATYALMLLVYAVLFSIVVAIQVRVPGELLLGYICIPRLHDLGRTGWWFGAAVLAEIVVVVGVIFGLNQPDIGVLAGVATLFLPAIALALPKGHVGPNRFGEAPASGIARLAKAS
jgi:uncharacterized membrane protein YhaH (DUF805 family)